MVIVGLVLPALPVIVAFTAGEPSERGFGLSTFPPTNCDSLQSPPVTFYSLVLSVNLILVTGIPLLVVIFWTIHKVISLKQHLGTLSLPNAAMLCCLI